jgi:hypothetical protein
LFKFCPSDGRPCFRSSCDYITPEGVVLVCGRHRNPHGRFKVSRNEGFGTANPVVLSPSKFVKRRDFE